jgi:hypothetical protein
LHVDDRMMPSFLVGVAVNPTTNLALTWRITRSNVKAERWWHSSIITCPYSATKSLTSLAMQALNNRYVDSSSSFGFAPADLADLVDWDFEEHSEPFPPLIKQLLAVHHH